MSSPKMFEQFLFLIILEFSCFPGNSSAA